MPEPHDHQWQDTGFAAVEDCVVPGCEAVRSEPNDKPEREWSYMDRQTGLTGDDVDEQGRLTYTTESASSASGKRSIWCNHPGNSHGMCVGRRRGDCECPCHAEPAKASDRAGDERA